MPNIKKAERREPLSVFYCVVCGKHIDPNRVIRKAVTCSEEHSAVLKAERRRLRDVGKCRMCGRPSTPEERAEFAAWRKSQGETRGRKKKVLEAETVLEEDAPTPLEMELGMITI